MLHGFFSFDFYLLWSQHVTVTFEVCEVMFDFVAFLIAQMLTDFGVHVGFWNMTGGSTGIILSAYMSKQSYKKCTMDLEDGSRINKDRVWI